MPEYVPSLDALLGNGVIHAVRSGKPPSTSIFEGFGDHA